MAVTEARVEDERGRGVPVVRAIAEPPRWPWKFPERYLLSEQAALWMKIDGAAGLGVIAIAIAASIVVASVGMHGASTAGIGVLVCSMAAYFVINQAHTWRWTGPGRRFAARAMAARGVCPSCGYDLAGVPQDLDGLTACPECGGAWRVGAIAACGRCAYNLMGTQPDDQGAVQCPECGWVWRADSSNAVAPGPRVP